MFPAFQSGMTPILASGAASLAGILVNRLGGSSSSVEGNTVLDPKAFERSLNRASGKDREAAPHAEPESLRRKLMLQPDIEAAILGQPAGSVSSLSIQADGSVQLNTSRGPVAVHLSEQSRAMAQSLYTASAVQGTAGVHQMGTATGAPVQIALQGLSLR